MCGTSHMLSCCKPLITCQRILGKVMLAGSIEDDRADNACSDGKIEPVILQAWDFSHPRSSQSRRVDDRSNTHSARFARLCFPCTARGVCHGLAGYFEAVLYESTTKNSEGQAQPTANGVASDQTTPDGNSSEVRTERIEISTNPLNMAQKSKDMISWFPIFFPLKVSRS